MRMIRIATRKSPLALFQAEYVKTLIEQTSGIPCQLVSLTTTGDRFLNDTLAAQGGKGAFVKELEHALLNHEADIAVHSMKDVPANLPPSLMITAYLTREDPRDVFLSRHFDHLDALPISATVGTASLRRKAILKHLRPDLNIELLRGNVQTRLEKLNQGNYDAIILAAAGLKRLNLEHNIKQYFDVENFIPAITQGILGIECLENQHEIQAILSQLNDPTTEKIALAERAFNRTLGGACHVPVAGFAQIENQRLTMIGLVANLDGTEWIEDNAQGSETDAINIGTQLAEKLLEQGAGDILKNL